MFIRSLFYKKLYERCLNRLNNPVFIVGCGHSGTSILLRIIGENSEFYTIKEESRIFFETDRERLKKINAWLEDIKINNKERIIEKTPDHLYFIDEILQKIKNAKIIYMLRDGRDVACSHKQRTSFEDGVARWVKASTAIKPYIDNENVLIVKLEELVSSPHKTLEGVMSFIGSKFEEDMLNYYKTPAFFYDSKIKKPVTARDGKQHVALRNWQINQPLFSTTRRWVNQMTENEKIYFMQEAQKELCYWGYELDDRW